jgi:hypothetical protein
MSSVWLAVLVAMLAFGMWITTGMGLKGFAIAIAAFLAHMAAGMYLGVVDLTPRPRGLVAAQRSDFAVGKARQNRQLADSDQANRPTQERID